MRIRDKLASSRARATWSRDAAARRPTRSTSSTARRACAGWSTTSASTGSSSPRGSSEADGVAELIRIAKAAGVQVSVLPRMLEVVGSTVEFEDIDGMTMLGVRPFGLTRSSRLLKRAFDLVATTIGLVAVAPIIAAIAARDPARLAGPGLLPPGPRRPRRPALQDLQVPLDGRRRRGAEGASARRSTRSATGCSRSADDPRVTRVGQHPAPHVARRAAAAVQRAAGRDEPRRPAAAGHRRGRAGARAGPQPAAPDARHDRSVAGARHAACRCRRWSGIDYLYVANWSLWLDVKILLRTVRHVLRRGNV